VAHQRLDQLTAPHHARVLPAPRSATKDWFPKRIGVSRRC
jgi:hypothetical protein